MVNRKLRTGACAAEDNNAMKIEEKQQFGRELTSPLLVNLSIRSMESRFQNRHFRIQTFVQIRNSTLLNNRALLLKIIGLIPH